MMVKAFAYSVAILLAAWAAIALSAGDFPPLKPSSKDKCPVCGMFVAKYPDWAAQIRFSNRKTVFFDGAKDLFKYYFKHNFSGREADGAIAAVYVTDYYSVKPIDAASAFFVIGSDVYGPMGKELIPCASAEEAAEFKRDHRGTDIRPFASITPQLLDGLE